MELKSIEQIFINSLKRVAGGKIDMYGLYRRVVCQRVLSQLSSNTRLLVTSERHLRVKDIVTIDPNLFISARAISCWTRNKSSSFGRLTVPALSLLAVLMARETSREKTAAANPYIVLLA